MPSKSVKEKSPKESGKNSKNGSPKNGDSSLYDSDGNALPSRTCIACDMRKSFRDMLVWEEGLDEKGNWTTALTPNDDEKIVLDLKLAEARKEKREIYLCESHFDRDVAFKLTPSGFIFQKGAMPEDVRNLFNDSASQNAPSARNIDVPPSPLSQPPSVSSSFAAPAPKRKGSAPTLKSTLEDEMTGIMPPPLKRPPPNTFDITGTTTEMGENSSQLVNMGGGAGATVKIEEIEDDEHLTWVNSVIPLETAEEREVRLEQQRAAAEAAAAAATMAAMAASVPVDTVDDCINSVIRQSLEPPPVVQSDLLKPKLSYETLCYEAFIFIEQNFQQISLKMSDICHYISHKYRYFASGIMWRKQVFRALNTADYINVERLDKPENKEDDSYYSLNKTEYSYRYGPDGEVRVRWLKRGLNKNAAQQPLNSQLDPQQQQQQMQQQQQQQQQGGPGTEVPDEERQRANNRAIPEASTDDLALINAIAHSLGVQQATA